VVVFLVDFDAMAVDLGLISLFFTTFETMEASSFFKVVFVLAAALGFVVSLNSFSLVTVCLTQRGIGDQRRLSHPGEDFDFLGALIFDDFAPGDFKAGDFILAAAALITLGAGADLEAFDFRDVGFLFAFVFGRVPASFVISAFGDVWILFQSCQKTAAQAPGAVVLQAARVLQLPFPVRVSLQQLDVELPRKCSSQAPGSRV